MAAEQGVRRHHAVALRCDQVRPRGDQVLLRVEHFQGRALAGLDFVRQAAAETSLPVFVIGGVNRATIGAAVAAGARRVAVSHAICQAEDPRSAARELALALPEA